MLERRAAGTLPDKPHTALTQANGALVYEHCLTREGFDGGYSILYQKSRPHLGTPASEVRRREPSGTLAGPVRRLWTTSTLEPNGSPRSAERSILYNQDVRISVVTPERADDRYFSNADGDDLYFVREGGGVLHSAFGSLTFRAGDYIVVPRGVTHRFDVEGEAQHWLHLECLNDVQIPQHYVNRLGQLRMDAPYSHRDFRSPEFRGPIDEGLRACEVQRGGRVYSTTLAASPFDAVGWDGSVYPVAFSIHRYSARVGQVHLPPNMHATFAAGGALICSFVPRLLDFHPKAIPCPYPHSSVHVDEVLYYCDGSFGSRKGVQAGALSLHPAGIAHGPHSERYEQSIGQTHTEELAVMVDCTSPLYVADEAAALEHTDYHQSF